MNKLKIILFFFITSTNCNLVFEAHRAGLWYPKDKQELINLLQKLSNDAKKEFNMQSDSSKIRAIISPHAGYIYSGKVAASIYNLIKNKNIDQIIIVGPSHFVDFTGIILPSFTQYRTPLGDIKVNNNSLKKLKNKELISFNDEPFKTEHSVELQLPFIQFNQKNVKIVPILVGKLNKNELQTVAKEIKKIITNKTLIVISSDFTHYGKQFNYIPFTENVLLRIAQLDSKILFPIQKQNLSEFEKVKTETGNTICGYNALRILLELIKQKAFADTNTRLVAYSTSYDKTKDINNIVSYAGLIVTNEANDNNLNKQEQKSLLTYSRKILEQAFTKTIDENLLKPILTLLLEKHQGVFPTLWTIQKNGKKELRGCIGIVYPTEPLYANVKQTTLDSAFKDPRFSPVQEHELKNILIEIQVLREPKPIKSYKEIILHKHGIILKADGKSALFLPNVPKEFGFNLTQTLEQLSLKAGLDKNAWKLPSTKFLVFEAQEFIEN